MTQTQRKGLSGLDKILIGCGIGCAALILVAVLGVAFGTMWFFTPGQQVTTDVIAGEDSLGVVRLYELAEDPGTQALISGVLERIDAAGREHQREQLPPSLRWISDMQAQQSNAASLNMLIPKEMTIVYEESEDGSDVDFVAAANPRTMVRFFKTMIGWISRSEDGKARADYAGHEAYVMDPNAHLAFVESTVLFASSRHALERAIDRIETGTEAGAPPSFELAATIPDGDWDVEGVADNQTGLIESLLLDVAPDDETAEAPSVLAGGDLRLGFGFDVVSAGEVVGRTVLECDDRQATERWRQILEERFQDLREEAAERGLEMEAITRADGRRVITELRLLGLEQALAEAFIGPLPEEDEDG